MNIVFGERQDIIKSYGSVSALKKKPTMLIGDELFTMAMITNDSYKNTETAEYLP